MLTAAQILDSIEATPEERAVIQEAHDCVREHVAWENQKRNDPNMPRQSRFRGTKADAILDRLPDTDERWVPLMEALRESLREAGIDMAGPA